MYINEIETAFRCTSLIKHRLLFVQGIKYSIMSDIEDPDMLELCALEYNKPDLSDRILVFDIIHNGWEKTSILKRVSATENTASVASQSENESKASPKFEDSNTNDIKNIEDEQKVVCNPLSSEDISEKTNKPWLDKIQPLRQHKVHVHSFWLSLQSPYFRALFHSSGMKEAEQKEIHMKISESEEKAHLILIEAMYRNDVLDDKSVDELLAVLELANKYSLKFVFTKCKYVLQTKPATFEISTKVMQVIKVKQNMTNVDDLLEHLEPAFVEEFSPLDNNWQSDKFTDLSESCLKYVLSSDHLIVQSENTVFHALMYWIEQNEMDPANLGEVNDLLSVVRFELVTIDYLYNVIREHPIASKMPNFSEFYNKGLIYHAMPSEQKKLLKERPVSRKTPEGKIFQYTFVVDKGYFEAVMATGSELNSETFWACGYQLSVGINPSSEYPYLVVHNLKRESYVPLKFAFFQKDQRESYSMWKETNFTVNSCREYSKNSFKRSYFQNEVNPLFVAVASKQMRN